MVNLLPVSINSEINLEDYSFKNSEAILTVLKGAPNDEEQKPISTKLAISKKLAYQLPAYSFSVIRIATLNANN